MLLSNVQTINAHNALIARDHYKYRHSVIAWLDYARISS